MERREFVTSLLAGGVVMGLNGTVRGASRELADHRIARIESYDLRDRFPRRIGRNAKRGPVGRGGGYRVRRVVTDQGAAGWGMSHTPDEAVRKLVGRPVGELFDVADGTADEALEVALDIVLWDLAGNILGRSVHAMLGDHGPRRVPIYSGAIYFEDLDPEDLPRGVTAVLDACRQDYEAGYRAFKLKIGRGFRWMPKSDGIRRDIEVTRAVREQFPDCQVLVDANDGYTCDEFLGYLDAVADCELYWIEEPFEENADDLRRLRDRMAKRGCRALIAEGETRHDHRPTPGAYGGYTDGFIDRLYALGAEHLIDVLLLDLGIVGYTRWRRIMPLLAEAGLSASPHTWMWTPRPCYAAQLAAGLGNVVIVEGIPGRAEGIGYGAYRLRDGLLEMPDDPGFGLALEL